MQLKSASMKVTAILYLLVLFFPVTFYLGNVVAGTDANVLNVMKQIGMAEGAMESLKGTGDLQNRAAVETMEEALRQIKSKYLDAAKGVESRLHDPEVAYAGLIGSWQEIHRALMHKEAIPDTSIERARKDLKRLSIAVKAVDDVQRQWRLYMLYGALLFAMVLLLVQIYFLRKYLSSHEEQEALTDRATQLYNRTYFLDEAANAAARAKRGEEPLSLIFFAIDDFEQYGLNYRGELVEAFGRLLLPLTRSSDVACRVGENEYVIIAPKTEAERVQILVERIRKAVAKDLKVGDKTVTISAGIAQLRQDEESQACVLRAEKTMYEAKKYRNKVAIAE